MLCYKGIQLSFMEPCQNSELRLSDFYASGTSTLGLEDPRGQVPHHGFGLGIEDLARRPWPCPRQIIVILW